MLHRLLQDLLNRKVILSISFIARCISRTTTRLKFEFALHSSPASSPTPNPPSKTRNHPPQILESLVHLLPPAPLDEGVVGFAEGFAGEVGFGGMTELGLGMGVGGVGVGFGCAGRHLVRTKGG